MKLKGKTVLITGASGGIGASLAKLAAMRGARVVLLARREDELRVVAQAIEAGGGSASVYPVDLADSVSLKRVVERIGAEVGVPDVLVNNAGIGRWRYLWEMDEEEIARTIAVPYLTAAWLSRAFVPGMMDRGSGLVVNLSSVASRLAWPGATAYIAACRAMRGLSDALRADLRTSGVRVAHYESGPVASPYWRNNPDSYERVPGIARRLVPMLTEHQAASALLSGIEAERRFIVPSLSLRLVYGLHGVLPGMVQWLMTATGYQPSRRRSA
ncbi:MAG: SDR family NAD(P)-dependent oxidoreductase [Chromatiales bacterium]|nr:SDR family NAD(P)-dependent oxidoreductase [Chromatiales bacterium]